MAWTSEVIATERLVLRCPSEQDRETITVILTDSEVRKHLGGPFSDQDLEGFRSHTIGKQSGAFVAVLTETGQPIGTFSIESSREREHPELSYQLIPEFWGEGLAFEASLALVEWGWDHYQVDVIIAVTQTANARSLRLLGRLGFVADTEFEEYGEPQTQVRLVRPTTATQQ